MSPELRQIIHNANMCDEPSYYSGRGATMTDLNGEHMESIYRGLGRAFGTDAQTGFLDMVEKLPKMSATAFLQALERLEWNAWSWTGDESESTGIECLSGAHSPNARMIHGMATIGAFLGGGRDIDQTPQIRAAFLLRHGRTPTDGHVYFMNPWMARGPGRYRDEDDARQVEIFDGEF